jgi:hypothetical protein
MGEGGMRNMIEIRILKIDERINDSSRISALPTNIKGQVIRKHDPGHEVYVLADGNHVEGLPYPDPLGRNTRWEKEE